mmetsp:Transcript_73365/g.114850  ORF Transcript_73365/g.114850 Transcript_73365/m.114850 type:complete len:82 (+) Transcript_73365:190-435(+)
MTCSLGCQTERTIVVGFVALSTGPHDQSSKLSGTSRFAKESSMIPYVASILTLVQTHLRWLHFENEERLALMHSVMNLHTA